MHISGLWRYPVKSMGGEPLAEAELTRNGITGDRVVHVRGKRGLLTGRTRSGLLTVPVRTGPEGVPWVDGHPWDTPAAAATVRARAGDDAHLVAHAGPERFDVLNLLVATDGAVRRFGGDIRRLRPNILVGGVPPEAERDWPGQALAVGDVVIGIHSVRQRCIVTSIDPDSGEQDLEVSRRIRALFGNELCLNCWIIEPGIIRPDDPVTLVPTEAEPRSA
ncbi:MOSC domain-containing protein [Amycolatopsis palatopharyngis]|uniref:MOSC domain-containing protein n=1 Tax=Amycolatopsis palatopharyngis TaxID=187982 RepID=UPI001B87AB8F|nr:MOSC N-terminal beta barrel domain-containing protein [Amycolatopsis palatopharyngis]